MSLVAIHNGQQSMTYSPLILTVDTWTAQAVVASRYLVRLYRVLGDEKQASNAIHSGAPAEERAQRLGLAARISTLQSIFAENHTEEIQREAHAWQVLVEAHAGICAFYAMTDGHSEKAHGLRGARNASTKAFQRSLQGYRVAFPEQMANEGISMAIRATADRCPETFLAEIKYDASHEEDHLAAAREVRHEILEALLAEADLNREGLTGSSIPKQTPNLKEPKPNLEALTINGK